MFRFYFSLCLLKFIFILRLLLFEKFELLKLEFELVLFCNFKYSFMLVIVLYNEFVV